MQHGVLDRQPVGGRLLADDDDVDVVTAPQAVVGHREQAVGIGRQVHTNDLGLLVHDMVDEAGVLMGEPVVVLAPDVRAEEVGERCDRPAPGQCPRDLQPLRVLVQHRIDDVDERFIAVEDAVATRQQVALEPALAKVFGQHLHHPAVRPQVVVERLQRSHERPVGDLEDGPQPVRGGLVRPKDAEGPVVAGGHIPEEGAQHPRGLRRAGPRLGHLDPVLPEVRQRQAPEQNPAVGVRIGTHAALTPRRQFGDRRQRSPPLVEELLGPVAAHPGIEQLEVARVGAHLGEGHLVRPEGALDGLAVHFLGAGPALRGPQHDHGPPRSLHGAPGPSFLLDVVDACHGAVERGGHRLVDSGGVVPAHEVRLVAVALHQRTELLLGDAGEHGGVGNLVAVEMQDRQHRPVVRRVQELVRVPARGQSPRLSLAVAHDAEDQQVGVVEGCAIRVCQRIAKFTALVNRSGRLGCHVAGHPTGEGELPEEGPHPIDVLADRGIDLGVSALEVGVGQDGGSAMARARNEDGVEVPLPDDSVGMHVDEVQSRCGPPVTEKARLDVLRAERLSQEWVVEEVDLAHRQVVRRPPPPVETVQLILTEQIAGLVLLGG